MMRRLFLLLASGGVSLLAISSAHAQAYTTIPIAGLANTSLATLNLPFSTGVPYGTPTTLGGVPFHLPSSGNNVWNAENAAGGGSGTQTLTMTTNAPNTTGFYTLIGTYWGTAGAPSKLSLTFNFSGGTSYVKEFFGNADIRDYNNGSYTNTINGTSTVQVYSQGSLRLDRQFVDLQAAGHGGKTLTSVVMTDTGNAGVQRAFIAGATAVSIPEPGTLALTALGGVGLLLRRRKK